MLMVVAALAALPAAAQQPAPLADARPLESLPIGRGYDRLPEDLRRAAELAQAVGVLIAWTDFCTLPERDRLRAEWVRDETVPSLQRQPMPLRGFVLGVVEATRQTYGLLPASTACDLLARQSGPALLQLW